MRRTSVILLGLTIALFTAVPAQAVIIISTGDYVWNPGSGNETVSISITTDAAEEISALDLYLVVNGDDGAGSGAPAPFAVSIDMDSSSAYTFWSGNPGGTTVNPYGDPWDVQSSGSTGHSVFYAAFTDALTSPNNVVPITGLLATLTFANLTALPGVYSLSLTDNTIWGPTLVGTHGIGALVLGSDYFLVDGTITIVPEPSSVVLGMCAAAALAAVVIRRRRAA